MDKYEKIFQKIDVGMKQRIEQLKEAVVKASSKDSRMGAEARLDEVRRLHSAMLDIKLVVLTDEANKELDEQEKVG